MDQKQHSKEDLAITYNKMREFLQFLTGRPDRSGALWVAEFGVAIAFAKGATEEEARNKIAERVSKPFAG